MVASLRMAWWHRGIGRGTLCHTKDRDSMIHSECGSPDRLWDSQPPLEHGFHVFFGFQEEEWSVGWDHDCPRCGGDFVTGVVLC
jgi:hypothetical protein